MAQELTELEVQRLGEAAFVTMKRIARRYGDVLDDRRGVYQGAASSLGTGWEFDEDGDVVEPPGGTYWRAGMAVGSAPVRV